MSINACTGNTSPLDALTIGQNAKKIQSQKLPDASAAVDPADPAPNAPTNSATHNLLQHVMVDWGMTNSPYDLDGSGMVDVADMLMAVQSTGDGSSASSPTIGTPSSPGNANTLAHLMIDFGQANSPYDLNGDGSVDVSDMLFSITNWTGGGENRLADATGTTASTAPTDATPAADGAAAHCGTEPADVAASADAATEEAPVAATIATSASLVAADTAAAATKRARAEIAAQQGERSLAPGNVRKLGAELLNKLYAAGFQDHPPSNILDVVDKLKLNTDNRRDLLSQIHERYPQGLGVNLHA